MVLHEGAIGVDDAEAARNAVGRRIEQRVLDTSGIELSNFVALVARETNDVWQGDVHEWVETIHWHGLIIGALNKAGLGEHCLHAWGDLALHADGRALEIAELGGLAIFHDEGVDTGVAFDGQSNDIGIGVVGGERNNFAE